MRELEEILAKIRSNDDVLESIEEITSLLPDPEAAREIIIRSHRPRFTLRQLIAKERVRELRQETKLPPGVQREKDQIASILNDNLTPHGEIEVVGSKQRVTSTIVNSKTLVSVLCPDFETRTLSDGSEAYVPGGSLRNGIGFTGKRLLHSLPLLEEIGKIIEKLRIVAVYHASSEANITDEGRQLVHKSAQALRDALAQQPHNFENEVKVLDSPDFLDKARALAGQILEKNEVNKERLLKLTSGRTEIIRMRREMSWVEPLTPDIKKEEAALDIAVHRLTEESIQEQLGQEDFVHLVASSPRFARSYKNPTIALCRGSKMRYEGD